MAVGRFGLQVVYKLIADRHVAPDGFAFAFVVAKSFFAPVGWSQPRRLVSFTSPQGTDSESVRTQAPIDTVATKLKFD